jgi:hypothetical protein
VGINWRATYQSTNMCHVTNWYGTAEAAQNALMKHRDVGQFHYLGSVPGDVAPRNGGQVSLEYRWTKPSKQQVWYRAIGPTSWVAYRDNQAIDEATTQGELVRRLRDKGITDAAWIPLTITRVR